MGAAGTPTYKPLGSGSGGTGPQGPPGIQGPPGFPGADGEDGDIGPPGLPGATGATGATGQAGPTGPIGPSGPAIFLEGDILEPELFGPPGPTGLAGATGAIGATGPPIYLEADILEQDIGLPGPQGPRGSDGPVGATGNLFLSSFDGDTDTGDPFPLFASALVGVGVSPQVAFWLSQGVLTGDIGLTYTTATPVLALGSGLGTGNSPELQIIAGPAGTPILKFEIAGTPQGRIDVSATNTMRLQAAGGYQFTDLTPTIYAKYTQVGTKGCIATFGQDTTGTDAANVVVRAGNSGTTTPAFLLNRNNVNLAQFALDGTNTFLDYLGTLTLRTGIAGSTVGSLDSAGSFTAVGPTHLFGTAGTTTTMTVGQGTTGADAGKIVARSGNNALAAATVALNQNGTDVAQWVVAAGNTFMDYAGIWTMRAGVAGTTTLTIDAGGKVTKYNSIATVTNGVPSEYAQVNLTAQGAAIGSTLLYAVPATGVGMYRISYVATVTRAATTSSTLGGTPSASAGGFQIDWTDADDSVSKLSPGGGAVAAGNNATPATPTNQANTTGASISGCIVVNAKASTNINYRIGWTSAGATTMQYNLHIRLEAM